MGSLEWWHAVAVLVGLHIVRRILYLRKSYQLYAGFRHQWFLMSPLSPLYSVRQIFTGVNPIKSFLWDSRHNNYGDDDILVVFSIVLGNTQVLVRSPELHKSIQTQHFEFEKIARSGGFASRLGDSISSTNGEQWKLHRRITTPAFNLVTYRNVWDETRRIYEELMQSAGWRDAQQVIMDDVGSVTGKLAMFLITNCGFGINMSWDDPDYDDKGDWTPNHIIHKVSKLVLVRSVLPDILFNNIPANVVRDAKEAYDKFGRFLRELIDTREQLLRDQGSDLKELPAAKDLLGSMVNSRIEGGKLQLSKQEIIANSWIFLFAGHETTASVLLVTMTMLALYPRVQEEVYHSILNITHDRYSTFDDYDALFPVLACFLESARMYPPAFGVARVARRDMHLPCRGPDGAPRDLAVPKGTYILMDIMGIGYNPCVHSDPEEWKPSRWNKIGDRDHFAFGYGPRVCPGKKFSTTEATAFLSSLLHEWRLEVDLLPGENVMAARERLLDPAIQLTLQYKPLSVKMIKRDSV